MSCTLASRFGPIAEAECLVTFLEREDRPVHARGHDGKRVPLESAMIETLTEAIQCES